MAWNGDTLAGMLPLNIQTQDTQLGPLRTLTFPIDGWGSFYGPIGPDPAAVLTACLQYLRGAPARPFLKKLDLRSLPDYFDQKSSNDTSHALADNGEVAMLDLLGNWDTYWAAQSGSQSPSECGALRTPVSRTRVNHLFAVSAAWIEPCRC